MQYSKMKREARRAELKEDVQKLEQIKEIYETTSDFLTASFYSNFMDEVDEQIEELQKAISNLGDY